jgi:uncharacterized zinc-type alcohol dehydrogenase-like protein
MKQTSLLVLILSALACFASAQTLQPSQRVPAKGFAVFEAKGKFQPHEFTRRPVGDNDVLIEIMYASV